MCLFLTLIIKVVLQIQFCVNRVVIKLSFFFASAVLDLLCELPRMMGTAIKKCGDGKKESN